MIRHFLDTANKAKTEARYWMWAAWTLPFVALAILVFEYYFGLESLYSKTLVIISVTFFTVSVFWWWWSINKIIVLLESFNRTEQHFQDVKHELRETRKAIRGE
jgi:hypothetical protein